MSNKTELEGKLHFHTYLLKFSLIAVFVFLLLISSLYYVKIKNFIDENKETSIQLRMNQISNELQTEFNNVYDTVNNLKSNEIVIRYVDELSGSGLTPSEKYDQLQNLEEYLYTIRQNNKLIDNILIITPETQFSSDKKYVDYKFNGMKLNNEVERNYNFVSIGEASSKIKSPLFPGDKEEASGLKDLNNNMFFGANLVSSDGTFKGVILVFINPKSLNDNLFYADHIGLFDQNGKMIFKGDKIEGEFPAKLDKVNQQKKGLLAPSKDLNIYYSSIPFYNFQLIYSEQSDFYKKQMDLMWKMIVITFVCSAVFAYIFSRLISRKVLRPLYRLIDSIKEYEESRNYIILQKQKKTIRLKISLRERFFFYFVLTVLFPLMIFMTILYGQTSKIVSGDMQESYQTAHENMARLINNEISQREITMNRIAFNNNVQQYMMNKDSDSIGRELQDKRQFLELRRQNIRIYDDTGQLLYTNNVDQPKLLDAKFMQKIVNSGRKMNYVIERDHFNHATIVIGMPILSPVDYQTVIGFITLDIESSQFAGFYASWQKTGLEMSLVDHQNIILSHQDPVKVGEIINDDEKSRDNFLVFSTKITGLDWRFISKYNYSDIQKQINQLFVSGLYLLFLILLLLLILAYWISKRMLRPIGQLNELFHNFDINGSHYELVKQFSGIDEVDSLTKNFNKMIVRLEESIQETLLSNQERIQLKYEKSELQLNALQSQINPHFLYNTLDNLIFLVETNETEKAVEMIASLSRLFRYITSREHTMITLRDEIIYTKAYIKIMSYRFSNFECFWDIDEKVLDYKTVKLILQPVIENAINHGARKTKKVVTIHISCQLIRDEIHIFIKDNASGIRAEDLEGIQHQLNSAALDKAGIYNVNGRIRLHFGSQYGLKIESEWGKGTLVTIVIPVSS